MLASNNDVYLKKDLRFSSFDEMQRIFNVVLRKFFKTPDELVLDAISNELRDYTNFKRNILHIEVKSKANPYEVIIGMYNDLLSLLPNSIATSNGLEISINKTFDYDKFKKSAWQYKTIRFLQSEAKKHLMPYIDVFLIHGSFATRDFLKNWSDLDTLMVLNNKTFASVGDLKFVKKELRKMALALYKIDPLAHHEFIFLTDLDLKYYPQFLFPAVLFDYSVRILGKDKIKIQLRDDKYDRTHVALKMLNYFKSKKDKNEYSKNNFFWKNDLSMMMLWPSLILQAKDIFVYKKYSFELVKKEFPTLDFLVIDEATKIMRQWRRINLLKFYPDAFFSFLPYIINRKIIGLHRKLSMRAKPKESMTEIKKITDNFIILAERGFDLIKNINNENRY